MRVRRTTPPARSRIAGPDAAGAGRPALSERSDSELSERPGGSNGGRPPNAPCRGRVRRRGGGTPRAPVDGVTMPMPKPSLVNLDASIRSAAPSPCSACSPWLAAQAAETITATATVKTAAASPPPRRSASSSIDSRPTRTATRCWRRSRRAAPNAVRERAARRGRPSAREGRDVRHVHQVRLRTRHPDGRFITVVTGSAIGVCRRRRARREAQVRLLSRAGVARSWRRDPGTAS